MYDSCDAKGYQDLKEKKEDVPIEESTGIDEYLFELRDYYQNEACPKNAKVAEIQYHEMRYEYLHLKASYYLIFRDKDLSRKTLYKLDR